MVRDLLKERGIPFQAFDVSEDPDKLRESVKLSGQMGVPVLDVGGKIVVGWNKDLILEAIGASGTV